MTARKTVHATPAESVSRFHCVKCKHTWIPRAFVSGTLTPPRLCPNCHCRKWQGDVPQVLSITTEEVRTARSERISAAIRSRRGAIPADIPHHTCTRCGHEWPIRSKTLPRACPKCNTTLWNKPRKVPVRTPAAKPLRLKCRQCGHEWTTRYEGTPKYCPACNSTRWDKPPRKRKAGGGQKASQGTTPGSGARTPRKDKTSQGQGRTP